MRKKLLENDRESKTKKLSNQKVIHPFDSAVEITLKSSFHEYVCHERNGNEREEGKNISSHVFFFVAAEQNDFPFQSHARQFYDIPSQQNIVKVKAIINILNSILTNLNRQ